MLERPSVACAAGRNTCPYKGMPPVVVMHISYPSYAFMYATSVCYVREHVLSATYKAISSFRKSEM